MPKLPQHQETTPSASISLIVPTTAKTLTISHTDSSICTFYKIYHNRAMCINFINHTNYGSAWDQYTNNTTKARIDFSKSEILNAAIALESSGVFTCTKLYESSFKYPIYWYNFKNEFLRTKISIFNCFLSISSPFTARDQLRCSKPLTVRKCLH